MLSSHFYEMKQKRNDLFRYMKHPLRLDETPNRVRSVVYVPRDHFSTQSFLLQTDETDRPLK